jgi:hypothetical protein
MLSGTSQQQARGRIDPTNAAFNTQPRLCEVGEFLFKSTKVFGRICQSLQLVRCYTVRFSTSPNQPPVLTSGQLPQQAQIVNQFCG